MDPMESAHDSTGTMLRCPFCGGEPEVEQYGTARASMIIACSDCGARVESGDVYGRTAPERWAWNLRYTPVPEEGQAMEIDAHGMAHEMPDLARRLEAHEQALLKRQLSAALDRAEAAEKRAADALTWTADDQPLDVDPLIEAAHPEATDDHATYAEAMRLVGAKRSKGALVLLVNWLMAQRERQRARAEAAEAEVARLREALEGDRG